MLNWTGTGWCLVKNSDGYIYGAQACATGLGMLVTRKDVEADY